MRLTILLGPFLPTPPGPGGAVERRWLNTAWEWSDAGHDVAIVSKRWADLPARAVDDRGVQHRRLTNLKGSDAPKANLIADLWYVVRTLPVLPRADVVVTNTFWAPIVLPRLKRSAGRVVVNVSRFPKGQLKLYQRADLFVTPSSSVAEAIAEQAPWAQARTHVVPNPIDVDRFYPPDTPRETDHREPLILYTGRIHREKGLELLIQAAHTLRDRGTPTRVRIVGPSSAGRGGSGPAYLEDLKRLAANAPITFDEPIYDRDQLRQALWDADVYCYPSCADRGESFGVAPLEAMATGLPPIVSGLPCFTDFVRNAENGRTFDHRADDADQRLAHALADTLDTMRNDPARHRRMSEAAAQTARAFSTKRVAEQYLEVFRELLGGAASVRHATTIEEARA